MGGGRGFCVAGANAVGFLCGFCRWLIVGNWCQEDLVNELGWGMEPEKCGNRETDFI